MSEFKLLTDRLLLREFTLEDAEGFFALNNDPVVLQFTGDLPFRNPAAAADFIESYDHYARYGYGRWTVLERKSGKYLGFCGLKYHFNTGEVDLGFRLLRRYWSLGYATEAAAACLKYGFSELKLPRIIGRARIENAASIRVLEKIGMIFVGKIDFDGERGVLYEARKLDL